MRAPDLALVLTFYNEAKILERSLNEICDYLTHTTLDVELIIIDDQSTDGSFEIAKRLEDGLLARWHPTVIRTESQLGRGACVDLGFDMAKAPVVAYIDTDLEVPVHYLLPAYLEMERGDWDLLLGTRTYVPHFARLFRRVLSEAYSLLSRTYLRYPYRDTLAGFKMFRAERYRRIRGHIQSHHWFWDTEVVYLSHRDGYRIHEMPMTIHPQDVRPTNVRFLNDTLAYLRDQYQLKNKTGRWKVRQRRD